MCFEALLPTSHLSFPYICSMNYFELFDLPMGPSVDKSLLAKKYFELQKASHPDFHTQSNEAEKDEALEKSAAINKAFNIFQDKEKTIEYFLQEKGLAETDEKYSLPPDFLMEMMEINEELAETGHEHVTRRVKAFEEELYKDIGPIIDNYGKAATGEKELLKLKEYYYKKKYLNRILDRLGD